MTHHTLTPLSLPPAALAAAVQTTQRGPVDPVSLLLAIHTATSPAELAAARLAAISSPAAISNPIWPAGCPVITGSDAVALGCVVGGLDDEQARTPGGADHPDPAGRIHVRHMPLRLHTRIWWVTDRARRRICGGQSPTSAPEEEAP